MKNSISKSSKNAILRLVIIPMLLTFTACEENTVDPIIDSRKQIPAQSIIVGPDGGTINALKANVTIEIPKGALLSAEKFTIYEGPRDDGNDFIIKTIIIEPLAVKFTVPARLRLRYDSQLSIGKDPCNAKCLAIYHFKNDEAFDKRRASDMIWMDRCYINVMDQCLETEIHSGGVFAIGEESFGQEVPDPS